MVAVKRPKPKPIRMMPGMVDVTAERSERIKQAAKDLGFDRCGIARAGPIEHGDFLKAWLAQGHAGTMGYLHRHTESRTDLRTWLPWARSVVVVASSYKQGKCQKVETSTTQAAESAEHREGLRGRVAMYAWGEDYHVVLREKLEQLVAWIREHVDAEAQSRICVDTSAIVERELAVAAGIGWIGKNTLVLNPAIGSLFFLGEIITDLELDPDAPMTDHCGTCTRCLDACPTAAFPQAYAMDARRCISYLTIEHRSEIDPELVERMGDWVFGCDDCQTVCPYNANDHQTAEPRFMGDAYAAAPMLDDILSWDEAAYHRAVTGKATDRARLQMWQRNAKIARRNLER